MKKAVLVLSVITVIGSMSMADYEGSVEHMNDLCKVAAVEISMEADMLFKQIFGVDYLKIENPTDVQRKHYDAIYEAVAKNGNEENKGVCQ